MERTDIEHVKADRNLFNDLMDYVGTEGKFQSKFNYMYNMAFMVLSAMPALNIILSLTSPDHWCHVPGMNTTNLTSPEWKELTIPRTDSEEIVDTFSKCSMYNFTLPVDAKTLLEARKTGYNSTVSCQYGWEYDRTWYSLTVTSQEDWVCTKELYIPNTLFFCKLGEVMGEVLIGQLGDTIGRRPVLFLGVALLVLGRCVLAVSAELYPVFLTAAVITSLPMGVIFQSPLIIGMEVSSVPQRSRITLLQCVGWTAGLCLAPLVAWAVGGQWQIFTILTTLPCAAVFLFFRTFPESPRWLVAKGKTKKCLRILKQIAKENGTSLPDNAIEILRKLESRKEKTYGVASLFSSWRLLRNTVLITSCVTLVQLINFTMILNIVNMSGNPFLNMFLQAFAEIPGFFVGRILCDRLGRRWSQPAAYFVVVMIQIACLIIVVQKHLLWLLIVLVLVAKFAVNVACYCVYLQCMELYPTNLRQTGTSAGVLVSTLIGSFSPYIVYLGTAVDVRYPYAVLIIFCLLGAVCGTLLPETMHQELPDTLEESAEFGAGQKFWSFPKRKSTAHAHNVCTHNT